MTNKTILALLLLPSIIIYTSTNYGGGSLAPVILAGSIVKHQGSDIIKKYRRKDCPVCKGTGKYLSGDGIKMVDCGYCEPEKTVTHPPINLSSDKCETNITRK
jgi:hypothetical protein